MDISKAFLTLQGYFCLARQKVKNNPKRFFGSVSPGRCGREIAQLRRLRPWLSFVGRPSSRVLGQVQDVQAGCLLSACKNNELNQRNPISEKVTFQISPLNQRAANAGQFQVQVCLVTERAIS